MAPSRPDVWEIAIGFVWFVVFPRGYFVARLGPRGLLGFIAVLTAVHYYWRTGFGERSTVPPLSPTKT